VEAARKLFMKGGEKALSMRALARLAHTNTPAVYRRFRNRRAILHVIMERYQQDLFRALQLCTSPQEACQRVLEFALARPREYELFFTVSLSKFQEPRPNFEYLKTRFAEWLGGAPEDHSRLALAMWAQIIGTATILISKALPLESQAEQRSVFSASIDLLVSNASTHRKPLA